MTGLLTAAAVVATILLLASAGQILARANSTDPHRRGGWGIAFWTSNRDRPLNPQERRWQTSLLSGRDNPARWTDVGREIEALEVLAGVEPTKPLPAAYDAGWVSDVIDRLETTMRQRRDPDAFIQPHQHAGER